jgi:hypothetical protein
MGASIKQLQHSCFDFPFQNSCADDVDNKVCDICVRLGVSSNIGCFEYCELI